MVILQTKKNTSPVNRIRLMSAKLGVKMNTSNSGRSNGIWRQNRLHIPQWVSTGKQNRNGPECDGNRTPALTTRMEVRHG